MKKRNKYIIAGVVSLLCVALCIIAAVYIGFVAGHTSGYMNQAAEMCWMSAEDLNSRLDACERDDIVIVKRSLIESCMFLVEAINDYLNDDSASWEAEDYADVYYA